MTEDTKNHAAPNVAKRPVARPQPPAETPGNTAIAEIGGPSGPEPTRYGDWERGGRCSDF
jgi:hypothetical protein